MIPRLLKVSLLAMLLSGNSFAQQWYYSPVYHGRNVYSLALFDRLNLVAGGGNEQNDSLQDIFKSTTGGMNWSFSSNQGAGYIRSMDFSDEASGIAVGYAGKILKTENGAASWDRIYGPAPVAQRNFTTVKYLTPQTVIALGGRNYTNDTIQTAIKSTDGGTTWNVTYDQAGRWFKGAYFFNSNTGFAVGASGTISKTTDGGSNWTPVNSPVTTRDFNAVHFIDATTGYIVGGKFVEFDTLSSIRTILKTIDGGNTWNILIDEPGGWLTAIDFIDQNTGYIVGDGATVYKTTNGNNWVRQTVNGTDWFTNFTSVKFLSEDFGAIGGMYGDVFLYSNETLPEVIGLPAIVTQVSDTNAIVILRANINTHGSPVSYNFVYSTTPDFSSNVGYAYWPAYPQIFNSSTLIEASATLNTFLPNTTYYYYVTVTAINGTVIGDTLSFVTTIPYTSFMTQMPQNSVLYTVFNGNIDNPTEAMNMYFEYGTTNQFGSEVQASPFSINAGNQTYTVTDTITTLQNNTVCYYRLKAVTQNSTYYANTVSFFAGSLFNTFQVTDATNITQTSATLNAQIDHFQLPLTNLIFEYGTDMNNMNSFVSANLSSINDTLQYSLYAPLSGLQPHTFYYYRLRGQTSFGVQQTNTITFFTGDMVDNFFALPPTQVSETFATLNGSVEGLIYSAAINFEYGTTPSLGTTIPAIPGFINDTLAHTFTYFLSGLQPGTQYWYRLKATVPSGTLYSNVVSFYTSFGSSYFQTLPATNVTASSARLNAMVNHFTVPLTFSFEYGLTDTLGLLASPTPTGVNDTLYHVIHADVTNLLPDTFYYFRMKATTGNQNFYTDIRKVYTGEPEIPNWNFENWDIDTLLLPEQWNIANDENFERVAGYSGSYALKISQVNFAILGFPGDGGGNNDGPNFYGGCAFSSRPDSVGFYLNYNINPLDSGIFISHLYSGDSIILTDFRFISGNSGGNFQRFTFPLEYSSTLTPDSLVLGFASFNPFSSVVNDAVNNFMIIDDIYFTPTPTHSCNIDFEDWFEFIFDSPQDWYYFKSLAIDPDSIEESRLVKKVQGINTNEYAVQIQNVNISGYILNASLANIKGKDFYGPTTYGTPVSRRYSRLNGYYKYACDEQDSVVINLAMFKNGINIANGRHEASGVSDGFQTLDVLISYLDEVIIPDSVVIDINTNNRGSATGYAAITIDRFSFDGIWGEVTDTTGIESRIMSNDDIKIYPNPARNIFTAEFSDALYTTTCASVIDINGRVIQQTIFPVGQSKLSFDVSGFDAGIYFVKIATGDKVFNKKIVLVK